MTSHYIKTDTVLDKILARKVEEIAERKANVSLEEMMASALESPYGVRDMQAALQKEHVALIAEVKRASPSKGVMVQDFEPVVIASTYNENGASAISVLTDEDFFMGHLDYLTAVRESVTAPVLRKDFIIDPYQVYEGRVAGADAILLIVAALSDSQLAMLYEIVTGLDMTPLVEVHNEDEMERALKLGATVIGINNRDLKTFTVDLETTPRLASMVSDDVVLVAESGIKTAQDVQQMGQLGAHAVLVGESLVMSGDMAQAVRDFSKQARG
jgi:indole-3-glycerol phosphate synthase